MDLNVEQIEQLAPDGKSIAAAKKLTSPSKWQNTGKSAVALWGDCAGSRTYQIKIDLQDFAYGCSCPSRKLPCKHVLALLYQTVDGNVPEADCEPDWIEEWIQKRRGRAEKKAEKAAKPVNKEAQEQRQKKRVEHVEEGITQCELWLKDVIANGLIWLHEQGRDYIYQQAARMTDYQMPGIAGKFRNIAEEIGVVYNWAETTLSKLGAIALLFKGYKRRKALGPDLSGDIKQMIGWSVDKSELEKSEAHKDIWTVVAQESTWDNNLSIMKTWLMGSRSRSKGLHLQFAAGGGTFQEFFPVGASFEAEALFYPGAVKQRLVFQNRSVSTIENTPPVYLSTIEEALEEVAQSVALNPFFSEACLLLKGVTPVFHKEKWIIVDDDKKVIHLAPGDWFSLAAISGGKPLSLCGLWNGNSLKPLSFIQDSNRWREVPNG